METIIKIVLGAALLPVLLLGVRMATGQAGRGHLTATYGLTLIRSILVPLWVFVAVWYVVAEATMPDAIQFEPGITLRTLGLALFIRAMLLRVWAQRALGNYWSADLSLRPDHQIIERGPYFWFVHPIYLAYWPVAIGLLCATGNLLLGGLALTYALVSYLRIPAEEVLLQHHFGHNYTAYQMATHARRFMVVAVVVVVGLLVLHSIGAVWEVLYLLY